MEAAKPRSQLASRFAAAEAGEKVVALDLDPQGSLAAWGDNRTEEAPAVDRLGADRLAELPQILAALGEQGFTLAVSRQQPAWPRLAATSQCRRQTWLSSPPALRALIFKRTMPTIETRCGSACGTGSLRAQPMPGGTVGSNL